LTFLNLLFKPVFLLGDSKQEKLIFNRSNRINMKARLLTSALCLLFELTVMTAFASAMVSDRQQPEGRKRSPGATQYFIDPVKGNDRNNGRNQQNPWKSFAPANQFIFSAGDRLTVLTPGRFDNSLVLRAAGTAKQPVDIVFAPGRYDFYDTNAYQTKLNISNTNDVPGGQKAIALLIADSRYVNITAVGARIVLHAKMIETCIDSSENISLRGISYDYNTPTVSEFKVTDLQSDHADILVNKDSHYEIRDSLLTWEGDGWQYKLNWYWQEFNPETGYVTRIRLQLNKARFAESGRNQLRVYFPQNPGFKKGFVYQTRDITRDCAGIFMQHSKNILLKNIRIYFMHGMGIVSQFCQEITMDAVVVKPDEASGRTCAAWADILHFSDCRGQIEIKNSYLSASNDDAVNVHGVYLRIVDQPLPNQLKLRFMHGQTYGFNAYAPGDSIELIHGTSLLPFANNVVLKSEMLNEKEILLTLKERINDVLQGDDAAENITWTPNVYIHHTTITSIPGRGILVTTRRKVIIANNNFLRTSSAGVLVEDDAEGWYESGPVNDLTIRNNYFFKCGEPVIDIHPENAIYQGAVHKKISVLNNNFIMNGSRVLSAKSTNQIQFVGNTIKLPAGADTASLTVFKDCKDIDVGKNIVSYSK
jgi:hypothetical protein